MGNRQSEPQDNRSEASRKSETAATSPALAAMPSGRRAAATRRQKSIVSSSVPKPFTRLQNLSTEWNLCQKLDPLRRVNVVSDAKLQRKGETYLFVEKCVRKEKASETLGTLQNELEIQNYIWHVLRTQVGIVHPNIVRLCGHFAFKDRVHLIFEFCELGNMRNAYIDTPDPDLPLIESPSEEEVKKLFHHLCIGVGFLHAVGVAHADLALENLFITQDNVLKVGDFDRAVFVGPENAPQPLKRPPPQRKMYTAPELYANANMAGSLRSTGRSGSGSPTKATQDGRLVDMMKADTWAMGIILITLLTKKPLFDSASKDDNGFQIFLRDGLRAYLKAMYLEQSAICKLSDDLLEVAEGLLTVNPVKRMSVREVLETNWLQATEEVADAQDGEWGREEDVENALDEEDRNE